MNLKELREEAKRINIIGYSKMSKNELEDRIALSKQEVVQMSKEDFKHSISTSYKVFEYDNEEDWHHFRAKRIGGSDVGAILGVNPYKSIIDVYIDKTQGSEFKGNEATYWGHMHEGTIMKAFAQKHAEFEVYQAPYSAVSERSIANIDGVLKDKNTGEFGILEIKTTNAFNYKDWEGEEVPQSYYAQVQHYLMCTGYNFAYIAVLIGGNHYKEFKIERNEEDIALISKKIDEFFEENLLKEIPPTPDGSDAYMKHLKERALKIESQIVEELDELEDKAARIKEIAAQKKILEQEENLLKEEILLKMIEHDTRKATAGKFKFNIQSRSVSDIKKIQEVDPETFKKYSDLEKQYKKESSRFLAIR